MNLTYVCRNCTLLGGLSRIAWELATRAVQSGDNVHLVARRLPARMSESGIQPHRVFQWPAFVSEWYRFRSFAWSSSRKARVLAGDHGVVHGFGDNSFQHILTLGNVDWNYDRYIPGRVPSRSAVYVKKKALGDPSLRFLVLLSQQMKQDVLDLIPNFDTTKMRTIYPGVDADRFARHTRESVRARLHRDWGIPPDSFWIVTAAGGDFEKRNTAALGRALLRLSQRPNWSMVFVGGTREQIAWPRELQSRTYFLGRMNDIGTALPGCDVMAYPAWYEEFGLVCLEGMASGLPLVVSRKVGASEVLPEINRQCGLLENPADDASLAKGIETLMDRPDLKNKISAANRARAQDFSWDKVFQQHHALYRDVAKSLSIIP